MHRAETPFPIITIVIEACLKRRCIATTVVSLFVSRSLPSNECIRHITLKRIMIISPYNPYLLAINNHLPISVRAIYRNHLEHLYTTKETQTYQSIWCSGNSLYLRSWLIKWISADLSAILSEMCCFPHSPQKSGSIGLSGNKPLSPCFWALLPTVSEHLPISFNDLRNMQCKGIVNNYRIITTVKITVIITANHDYSG
jgi:hypothetical protein